MSKARKTTARSQRLETKPAPKSKKADVVTQVEEKQKSVAKPVTQNNSGTKISKLPERSRTAKVVAAQMTSQSISQSLKSIREASTSLRSTLLSRSGIASLILVATALLAGGGFFFANRSEQSSAVVVPAAAPMAESPVMAPVARKPVVIVEKNLKRSVVKKAAAKAGGKSVAKSQTKIHGKKQSRAKDRRQDRRMVAANQY